MANKNNIFEVTDRNGNLVSPRTTSHAVIMDSGKSLEHELIDLKIVLNTLETLDGSSFQTKVDTTLNTDSKNVVYAINSLLERVIALEEGSGSESGGSGSESGGSGSESGGSGSESGGSGSSGSDSSLSSTLTLTYDFANSKRGNADGSLIFTSTSTKNNGEYALYWANSNGKIPEFQRITSFTLNGSTTKTYDFASLNAIPETADRVIAVIDGTTTVKAQYKIDSSKLINKTKQFCFGALSDVHLNADGKDESKSISDFKAEIAYFKEKGVKAICTSGDITRNGTEADSKMVIKRRQELETAGIPLYNARGNHDIMSYAGSHWNEIEPNGRTFEKEISGEIFVFMGLNSDSTTNPFDSTQITELREILAKYTNRRVFLFEHYFVGSVGNVSNLYPYGKLSESSGTAKEFRDILKANKNVIIFTGHSHLAFDLQRLSEYANIKGVTTDYCARVHIPSGSRPRKNDSSTSDTSSNTYTYHDGAYGYLIDVYDGFIVLKGRDFVANRNLPYATYILETN